MIAREAHKRAMLRMSMMLQAYAPARYAACFRATICARYASATRHVTARTRKDAYASYSHIYMIIIASYAASASRHIIEPAPRHDAIDASQPGHLAQMLMMP
jgi:hypothetical protein